MIWEKLKKLNYILSKQDKLYLFGLFFFSVIISIVEIFGVGIIMPFIQVATNFQTIFKNSFFSKIYNWLGCATPIEFIVYFGIGLVSFYLIRGGLNLFYSYTISHFAFSRYHILAYRLFENYLGMDYRRFIERNRGELVSMIGREANHLANLIYHLLLMFSEMLIFIIIVSILFWANLKMTLLILLFLAINGLILKFIIFNRVRRAGEVRSEMYKEFHKVLLGSFGNFKIIKLKGNEQELLEQFKNASHKISRSGIIFQTLSQTPRLFLETIGFSLIALVVVYLILKYQKDINSYLPLLSLFVLGLYRLLPSVNRLYSSYQGILYNIKGLDLIHNDLIYEPEELGNEKVEFKEKIELKGIYFGYRPEQLILKGLNLTIKKGEKIGIVGESGKGKSTLVDLIIGLYKPQKGKILIDGIPLTSKNIRNWRRKIGYIPQQIYLIDGTVAENVAFGEKMDREQVKKVLKLANLLDFLEKEQNGIDTQIGDNGIKLSGGQKQRVAIARALYSNPEILILDEATSALDSETETKIMDEIYKIGKDKTMIIIAHRLSTLDRCDRIVKIEELNGNGKR